MRLNSVHAFENSSCILSAAHLQDEVATAEAILNILFPADSAQHPLCP